MRNGNGGAREGRVRILDDGLELKARTPGQAAELRALASRVNGPCSAQPFMLEGPPGCFRLFVGEAAGRMRTARGIC